MRRRLLALLAVLTVGLVPALAAGQETADPAASATPVVLVKAYSTVVGVATGETGTTVTLDVAEAHEWLDGSDAKTLATGINGQRIVGNVTEDTVVYRGDDRVGLDALKPGMKVKAMLRTDGTPVTPTCDYSLLQVYIEAPKPVHPGTKFELGFFPRLWHMRGPILGLDRVEGRNIMNLDVRRLENAPRRFRDEGVRLVSLDAYVIVPDRVVITDEHGMRIRFDELQIDDRVKVVGKFLRPSKWMTDESGDPTPTLLAKRIKVKVGAVWR
jgi:hypothetical protein